MIEPLKKRESFKSKILVRMYPKFASLIEELEEHILLNSTTVLINQHIHKINDSSEEKELVRRIRKAQNTILRRLEKHDKLVPKDYYKRLWMVLGMSAFGIPLGVAFATAIGNMGMFGIGLPIGMTLGIAFGAQKDKQAAIDGRQLRFKNQ